MFRGVSLALIAAMMLCAAVVLAAARPEQPQPAQRVATADVFGLVERMMGQPALLGPRDELTASVNARVAEAQQGLERMQADLQSLAPNDPQGPAKQQEFLAARDNFARLYEQSGAEVDRLNAQQLVGVYLEARAAIDAVATRRGYTTVIANRAPDAPFDPPGMALALQELLARPVVKSDPADDITGAVEEELKLPPR